MKLPAEFQAAGVAAGIKSDEKLDMGIICAKVPLYWAMTTTQNTIRAPFIVRNRARYISEQPIQALAINSGIANCLTGDQGFSDNDDFAAAVATNLQIKLAEVITASTGVLGERLPVDKIKTAMPKLKENLSDNCDAIADAILTTDTRCKKVAVNLSSGARIVGIAKGSGMIHPNMATMLVFVMTDVDIPQKEMREFWPQIVGRTFNQISIDGDTSTNDSAFLLSSHRIPSNKNEVKEILKIMCSKLAKKIARDGEGASKLIAVQVVGARNDEQADLAAKSVVRSPLVKAAVHGNDPNWGRVLSAIGAAGIVPNLADVSLHIQEEKVYHGKPLEFDAQTLSGKMSNEEVTIKVNLSAGTSSGEAWGCDLSAEYVRINADYHT